MIRRLLLIEDDEDLGEIFQVMLRSLGDLEVLLAESGQAGVAIARREKLDAILLDVMMPGMNGIEVFQKLQTDPSTRATPVIFLTMRSEAEDRKQLLNLGAKAVIRKGNHPMQLATQVLNVLDRECSNYTAATR